MVVCLCATVAPRVCLLRSLVEWGENDVEWGWIIKAHCICQPAVAQNSTPQCFEVGPSEVRDGHDGCPSKILNIDVSTILQVPVMTRSQPLNSFYGAGTATPWIAVQRNVNRRVWRTFLWDSTKPWRATVLVYVFLPLADCFIAIPALRFFIADCCWRVT